MKARRVTEQDELIAAVTAHADTVYNCFLTVTASSGHTLQPAVVSLDTLLPVRKGSVSGAAADRAELYSTAVADCITAASTTAASSNYSSSRIIDNSEKWAQQITALTRKLSVAAVGHSATDISASRRALLNKCFPAVTAADDAMCDVASTATATAAGGIATATAADAVTAKCDSDTTAVGSGNATSVSAASRGFNRECWYRLEHVLPLEAVMRSELALLHKCYAAAATTNSNSSNNTAVHGDGDLLTAVDAQIGVKGGCMRRTHTGITDQYLYRSLYALQLHRCTR
jgi:hypothetical protein